MGRREDSRAAIGALNRHVEALDSACFDQRGVIEETPDNATAIVALSKNRLAYPLEDSLAYQIHGKVRHLFDHVTNRHRYRRSHGRFASTLEDLDSSIHSYRHALGKNMQDCEHFMGEIQENVMELEDAITDTVNMFHNIVNDEFSVVVDIGERIRQTKRCLDEISMINNVFESLGVSKMREWVGADLQLEKLLMKKLKRHVDISMRDLASSNRKLQEMLSKFIKDKQSQKLNGLIDFFHNQFIKDPGFDPNIDDVEYLPSCASFATPIPFGGYVNLDSPIDTELLQDMSVNAILKAEKHVEKTVDEEIIEDVVDNRNDTMVEQVHPSIQHVEDFYEALNSGLYPSLSAMDAYHMLKVEETPEDWMILIVSYYIAQQKDIDKKFAVLESSSIIEPYNGTKYVSDIRFNKRQSHG